MKQRNNNSKTRRAPRMAGSPQPPPFSSTFVVKKKIRFASTGANSVTIKASDLGDLWMTTPTAATGFQIANFVRVRKLELWTSPVAASTPVFASIEWAGTVLGLMGKSVIHTDTHMGADTPAHVVSRPPPGSQVAQWFAAQGTTPIVTLDSGGAAAGPCVLDLTIEFVVRDDGTAVAVSSAPAGATVGATYVRALDSSGASTFKVQGLATK